MKAHEQASEELVQYALGELDPAQAAEVREHVGSCAACRRELEEVQAELALLALSVSGPAPPARVKESLLRSVSAEPRMRRVKIRRPWWSLAPTFAAVILAIFGLLLYSENTQLRRDLRESRADLEQQRQLAQQGSDLVHMVTSRETAGFTLVSASAQPQPQARAMYSPQKGAVLLLASHLQPIPDKKAYELWLLPPGGKPMPAGTFKPDRNGNANLFTENVQCHCAPKTFAVTIEPETGSATPTMPIVMAGN